MTGHLGLAARCALVIAPALLAAGCASGSPASAPSAHSGAASVTPAGPLSTDPVVTDPAVTDPVGTDPVVTAPVGTAASGADTAPSAAARTGTAACARKLTGRMTDAQLAAQVFIAGVPLSSPAAAQRGAAAAAAAGAGNAMLYGRSDAGVTAVRGISGQVGSRLTTRVPAAGTSGTAAGIRPLIAVDQEGGQVQSLSGAGFDTIPPALTQGGWTASRLQAAATRWGRQLRAAGITVDFAPVADVVPSALGTANEPIGRYDREFGHTPATVSAKTTAVARGLQAAGVMATAKHFPGLGRVRGNTDVSQGVTDTATHRGDPFLEPFQASARAGVRLIMISSARYPAIDPGHLAVFSPAVMALLRGPVGFRGLIVSDDLGGAAQVSATPVAERGRAFLAAGGQLVLVAHPASALKPMVDGVRTAMRADPGFRATVRAAAEAVIAAKAANGLVTC